MAAPTLPPQGNRTGEILWGRPKDLASVAIPFIDTISLGHPNQSLAGGVLKAHKKASKNIGIRISHSNNPTNFQYGICNHLQFPCVISSLSVFPTEVKFHP